MNKLVMGLLATSINKKYREQIKACRETWIPLAEKMGVPVLLFGGYHKPEETPVINLPDVQEDYDSCTYKQSLGLKYMYEKHPSEFYFFGGTDNYVVTERLLKYLEDFDFSDPISIGGHADIRHMGLEFYPFLSGGGGVIISHPLMKRLYDGNFLSRDICILWEKLCLKYGQSLSYACDATLAYVLHKPRLHHSKTVRKTLPVFNKEFLP